MTDINSGDVFAVPFTVLTYERDAGAWGRLPGCAEQIWLPKATLLAGRRIARPLQVGDRVRLRNDLAWVGKVLVIDRNVAGVRWDETGMLGLPGKSYDWPDLSDLERAPDQDGQP